ncbi:unnamed protein product [Sphenostylis stenocarpa]|uniref:Uncharacterized protein n=1 Tax=Sphenostylis stenocarpa TaxID=92480 RepID=A0AA86SVU5_9FABA|nr:unnamed protein product [Sphenostylis stenocarpa]
MEKGSQPLTESKKEDLEALLHSESAAFEFKHCLRGLQLDSNLKMLDQQIDLKISEMEKHDTESPRLLQRQRYRV